MNPALKKFPRQHIPFFGRTPEATTMNRTRRTILVLALALLLAAAPALATTVTFRQGESGYTGAKDTYVQQNPANAGTAHGTADPLNWDGDDPANTGNDVYTLLRFDNIIGSGAGQVPPGAQITSATLTYTVSDTGDTGDVHEILVNWADTATFTSFCGSGCNEGVQYNGAVATAPAPATGAQTIDVTASVQRWASGGTNYGWIVLPTGTGGVDIRSAEGASVAERPLLTVRYNEGPPASSLVRQPYLQLGTPTSMTVVWRTSTATNSRVNFGTTLGSLTQHADNASVGTDHYVTITNLAPATKYFYDVGTTGGVVGGGTSEHYFVTSPATGASSNFRAWIFGDSGICSSVQDAVLASMLSYAGSRPPDLFLHAGDIAQVSGQDQEYTDCHLAKYATVLRHTPFWPAEGNHDSYSTSCGDGMTCTGPYFSTFVLPASAEAGGVASGTEAYYSYDYGNTHFVVLNGTSVSRSSTGPMANWLRADLAATNAQWIVAYWHQPPYTKGTHDSDTETECIDMRQNILPILEAGGVDLVLNGHSHGYERSYLIQGAYTTPTPTLSTLISGGNILDSGDGKAGREYRKPPGKTNRQGTIYGVVATGGMGPGGAHNHPVMYYSESANGSALIDVTDVQLTLTFLRSDGSVRDTFSIVKGDLPPRVASTAPSKSAVISALPSVAVTFTKDVTGVDAADLTVNGSPAATVTPVDAKTYVFSGYAAPGEGTVAVVLAAGGIADAGNAGLPFEGDSWTYTFDTTPPRVKTTTPARGAQVGTLAAVTVTFTKPVYGVKAADLTVGASAATALSGVDGTAGPYTFTGYTRPGDGLVPVLLAAGTIHDADGRPFAGDSWNYKLIHRLVINEFLASNNTTARDENGEFDDYFEIFNPGREPVELSGMFLTDDLDSPAQYKIPDGVVVPALGHIVFWCDSQPGQGPLHTNFNLARTGEDIGLYDTEANGLAPIDTLTYTTQTTDVASGRFPDGQDGMRTMPATPGAPNTITCGAPADCAALNGDCTAGACTSGRCVASPINEGLACESVDCMGNETCSAGVCDGGTDTCPSGQVCNRSTELCEEVLTDPLPIALGETWSYRKGTSEPTPSDLLAWTRRDYAESGWLSGPSGFGYGTDCAHGTTLSDMQNGYVSLYLRKLFHVDDPARVASLTFTVDYDDGFVAYLNGTEVARGNVAGTPPLYGALATVDHECSGGTAPANPAQTFDLTSFRNLLVAGNNVLAIQAHNLTAASTDFTLNPTLSSTTSEGCTSNADCLDANSCTDDVCDLGTGTCSHVNDDANTCSDGIACTTDHCSAGLCLGSDACTGGQTCNHASGLCETASVTVTFRDGVGGYTGTVDTYLEATATSADHSTTTPLVVDGTPVDQILLRFDGLFQGEGGTIPPGSTITSATLTVYITNGSVDGAAFHRMLVPWLDTSTWDSLLGGVQQDGVESVATADVASLLNSTNVSHTINVTNSVAAWSAGQTNRGWVLVHPVGGSGDSWQFVSSEGTTVAQRPQLSITYTPPATACTSDGQCDDGNPCTDDACNLGTGACTHANDDTNACTDGVSCTTDSCAAGTCVSADACTGGKTCNHGTGLCESGPVTVSFQDGAGGYAGTQDTYVLEAEPTIAKGGLEEFRWDTREPETSNPATAAFGLLRFENLFGTAAGQIPPGSTISSATLTLEVANESAAPAATINEVAVDWNELTTAWSTFGGDAGVQADEYGAYVGDGPLPLGTFTLNVTASLQAWSNAPATNRGWIFRPNSTNGLQVRSSEYAATPAQRPKLTVTYLAPGTGCTGDAECSDGQFCNGVETCVAGVCQAGIAPNCADAVACTTDSCNEASDSCAHVANNAACSDGNPCTDDVCGVLTGCSNPNNTAACSDGSACTTGDTCASGACVPGTPVVCNDGIACTADSCDAVLGCRAVDACTGGTTCNHATGVCESGPATVSFQDGVAGYTGTLDTYLHAGSPTANNAAVTPLVIDGPTTAAPGDERHGLLRFESLFQSAGGPIPDGSTIGTATLTLYITNESLTGAAFHRMLSSWSDTATWTSTGAGIQANGVEAAVTADVTPFSNTPNAFFAIDVTNSVAAWSAGQANLGWALLPPGTDSWQFASSEATTVAQRPKLTVTYTPPATGPTARISCALLASSTTPGGNVGLDTRLANLGDLPGVRGYQTEIAVTRTSGSGSVTVACPGGVAIDENRPEYLFSGSDDDYPVTNCALKRAASTLGSGSRTVGGTPAYLAGYTLTVSADAAVGSTFEVNLVPSPGTELADANADPIAFEIGAACTLTVTGCTQNAQCDDGNPCTNDTCGAGTCQHAPNTAACDDGDVCTVGDACSDGACRPGTQPLDCSDGNVCTSDTCDPQLGCRYANNTAACDDGNACTTGDTCQDGSCRPGTGTSSCDDGNPCTTDSCDAVEGCRFVPNTAACDDGNICTVGDVCSNGACQAGAQPLACDDGDACTADACSPLTGCTHASSCGIGGSVFYYRSSSTNGEPTSKGTPRVPIDATADITPETQTDLLGTYALPNRSGIVRVKTLAKWGTPRAADHGNAISSSDASEVARHAALLTTLSPNQQVAADVSGNGTISAYDASLIAQFRVQLIDHFPVATSTGSDWRFFRCDHYASATSHDCTTPQFLHDPLAGPATDDFYAVLYGEVTGNWNPPAESSGDAKADEDDATAAAWDALAKRLAGAKLPAYEAFVAPSTPAVLTLSGWTGPARPGERRDVVVAIDRADGISGLDVTLDVDPHAARVVDVRPGSLAASCAVARGDDGRGRSQVALYGPVPLAGAGDLLVVTIEVVGQTARTAPLAVRAVANEGRIPLSVGPARPARPTASKTAPPRPVR